MIARREAFELAVTALHGLPPNEECGQIVQMMFDGTLTHDRGKELRCVRVDRENKSGRSSVIGAVRWSYIRTERVDVMLSAGGDGYRSEPMTIRPTAVLSSLLFAITASASLPTSQANALTLRECAAKYKAALEAGTAKGVKLTDFRKAECGTDATAAGSTSPKPDTKDGMKPTTSAPVAATTGSTVFPTAVAPKYSGAPAGKARLQTCLDQYKANKASNGNGGLNFIQKGGGYYSECNKRLKG